jgi:hypothetical protein
MKKKATEISVAFLKNYRFSYSTIILLVAVSMPAVTV